SIRTIMKCAARLGIKYMTYYAFSTENWNRPKAEVDALLDLMMKNLEEEIFVKNNVRFMVIGDMSRLSQNMQDACNQLMERTKNNDASCMVAAFSYSTRWEMQRAVRNIAEKVQRGEMAVEDITDKTIDEHLMTNFMPEPELLIRTGGEQRLSNFLLWQAAYSELYFTDTYWPDFDEECLYKAIVDYQHRQRRFGKTGEQVTGQI
ncbi:MAG: di-trans,poly-cis-decaprenylcistransferase, partial [Bacteroidaceae bacterium]|nr:di-trans,poly-cis-decaprenylcistransferase [Bacteroidaceae bacterium]